ncbi:endonuclease [Bacillus sp. M6-12]|uniref:endonuclease/exonuclease/phosphatase family protein n=1 Tax=Bacillus sp. M6-12 TaxID=2054166 RepID=UPI000C77EA61|nr:endonuclease/exonuclease/phosphatase family protein [Bacillus sp. M6-12]PLS14658.1 endonuclease [Bacillus sp. M6-12]
MEIKVMSFNIHQGRGIDKKLDLQRIAEVIKYSQADIIGLNEVDRFFSARSRFEDQALYLANELEMNYVYGPAVTIDTPAENNPRQFGNAILTRFQIVKSENHPFDFLPKVVEDRALLEVTVKAGKQEVTAFTTHLSLTPFLHQRQATFIVNAVKKSKGPSFVMGDWNMTPYSIAWRKVTKSLKDAWLETNLSLRGGNTFPSARPFRRLDYIFTGKELEPVDCRIINSDIQASDHLPVLATLQIKPDIKK